MFWINTFRQLEIRLKATAQTPKVPSYQLHQLLLPWKNSPTFQELASMIWLDCNWYDCSWRAISSPCDKKVVTAIPKSPKKGSLNSNRIGPYLQISQTSVLQYFLHTDCFSTYFHIPYDWNCSSVLLLLLKISHHKQKLWTCCDLSALTYGQWSDGNLREPL